VRPAAGKKNIPAAKCKEITQAIRVIDVPERVKEMLAASVSCTVGHLKASRHPFNERFVAMIGEVLESHKATLEKDVSAKEVALAELTPAKAAREETFEAAKVTLAQCGEALEKAKQEVKDAAVAVKEATAVLKEKTAEQTDGDKAIDAVEKELATLKSTETDSLGAILAGDPEPAQKQKMLQAIMDASKAFKFDGSLMEASFKVLEKGKDDRGEGFDETCMCQLKASFAKSIAKLEADVAEGAPGKAARAVVVEEAASAKATSEKTQEEKTEASAKAKEEKEAAAEASKAAKQSLDDFLPDLKKAGEALDSAKATLEAFTQGPFTSYAEMKDLTEDTFKEPEVEAEEEKPAEVAAASEKAEEEAPQEDAEGEPAAKKARTDTTDS
jgi:hypothetical protein